MARAWALSVVALSACHGSAPPGPRVIVSNEVDGTISVIDAKTREVTSTLAVGKRPRGLRVSRDGKTLYVALSGSPRGGPGVDESKLPPADRAADGIGVVDLGDLSLVRTIPSGQDPEAFDLVGDDLIVVSNEETAQASLVDLDKKWVRGTVPVGREPEGVTTAPDGTVWVTNEGDNSVTVLDPVHATVLATVATGLRPRAIAFADGRALVTGEGDGSITVIDQKTRAWRARIDLPKEASAPMPPKPMGIAITGKLAYVTTGRYGAVAVIDIASGTVTKMIPQVGARPWGIAAGGDGLIYTANGSSNDVSVIDGDRVVAHIPAGGSPWGVVVTR